MNTLEKLNLAKQIIGEELLVISNANTGFNGSKKLAVRVDDIVDGSGWFIRDNMEGIEVAGEGKSLIVAPYTIVSLYENENRSGGKITITSNVGKFTYVDYDMLKELNANSQYPFIGDPAAFKSFTLSFSSNTFYLHLTTCDTNSPYPICGNKAAADFACADGLTSDPLYCNPNPMEEQVKMHCMGKMDTSAYCRANPYAYNDKAIMDNYIEANPESTYGKCYTESNKEEILDRIAKYGDLFTPTPIPRHLVAGCQTFSGLRAPMEYVCAYDKTIKGPVSELDNIYEKCLKAKNEQITLSEKAKNFWQKHRIWLIILIVVVVAVSIFGAGGIMFRRKKEKFGLGDPLKLFEEY